MRQQVVKGPLKINVIMKALCGGLSGHGNDQQQDEEEVLQHYVPPAEPVGEEQAAACHQQLE